MRPHPTESTFQSEEMSTASPGHKYTIVSPVVSDQARAFHSDVCVPPKHSDLRQVAEDTLGKASLYASQLCCFDSRDCIYGTINGLLSNCLLNFLRGGVYTKI